MAWCRVILVAAVCALSPALAWQTNYGRNDPFALFSAQQGRGKEQSTDAFAQANRDFDFFNGFLQRGNKHDNQFGFNANSFSNQAAKAAANGKQDNQAFDQKNDKFDNFHKKFFDNSRKMAFNSGSFGNFDKKAGKQAYAHSNSAAKKDSFDNGKVLKDNIVYKFDKDFNNNLNETGGYVEEAGHKDRKVDTFVDKGKLHKLSNNDFKFEDNRNDAQHAVKAAKYNHNANQAQVANGKFGQRDNASQKAGDRNDFQSVLFDRKDNVFKAEDAGQDKAVRKASKEQNAQADFGKKSAADANGYKGQGDQRFQSIPGGKTYGANIGGKDRVYVGEGPGYQGDHGAAGGAAGYAAGAPVPKSGNAVKGQGGEYQSAYGEKALNVDSGKKAQSEYAANDAAALNQHNRTVDKVNYDQVKGLRDTHAGKLKAAEKGSNAQGYSNKDAKAQKHASGGDSKFADASAQSNAKAFKSSNGLAKLDKDVFKQKVSDNSQNYRKMKKFFHTKSVGGKNNEDLVFNRNNLQRAFGDKASAQKEENAKLLAQAQQQANKGSSTKMVDASNNRRAQSQGGNSSGAAHQGSKHLLYNQFEKDANQSNGSKKAVAASRVDNRYEQAQRKQNKGYDKTSSKNSKDARAREAEAKHAVQGQSGQRQPLGGGLATGYGVNPAQGVSFANVGRRGNDKAWQNDYSGTSGGQYFGQKDIVVPVKSSYGGDAAWAGDNKGGFSGGNTGYGGSTGYSSSGYGGSSGFGNKGFGGNTGFGNKGFGGNTGFSGNTGYSGGNVYGGNDPAWQYGGGGGNFRYGGNDPWANERGTFSSYGGNDPAWQYAGSKFGGIQDGNLGGYGSKKALASGARTYVSAPQLRDSSIGSRSPSQPAGRCFKQEDYADTFQLSADGSDYPSAAIVAEAKQSSDVAGQISGLAYRNMAAAGEAASGFRFSTGLRGTYQGGVCPADSFQLLSFTLYGRRCWVVEPQTQKITVFRCRSRDCATCRPAYGVTKCVEEPRTVPVLAYCLGVPGQKVIDVQVPVPQSCRTKTFTC